MATPQDMAEHKTDILNGCKRDAELNLQAVRLAEDLCMERAKTAKYIDCAAAASAQAEALERDVAKRAAELRHVTAVAKAAEASLWNRIASLKRPPSALAC